QELEQKRTDAGAPAGNKARIDDNTIASAPPDRAPPPAGEDQASGAQDAGVPMEPEVLVDNRTGDPAEVPSIAGAPAGTGEPPTDFGTITFDEKGNVTGGSVGSQTTQALPAPVTPTDQAAPNAA